MCRWEAGIACEGHAGECLPAREEKETAHRLAAYSDAVFAVIVTVMVLVSLLPFATAWIARTRLGSPPVAFYAGLFVCIDIAYNVFEREVLARADATLVSERTRHMARRRLLVVLAFFTTAMLVALVAPRLGFGLICGALILHLRPEVPGSRP